MFDSPTVNVIENAQEVYETTYKEKYGNDKEAPPLFVAVSSCFSEAVLMSLPKELREKVCLITDDSETNVTYQLGTPNNLRMLTANSPEEAFVGGLLDTFNEALRVTLPTVTAGKNGVLDGDALRDYAKQQEFGEIKKKALERIDRLPEKHQAEARAKINALKKKEDLYSTANQGVCALMGYLAKDNPYTPYESYNRQRELIKEFTDGTRDNSLLAGTLSNIDENHRALLADMLVYTSKEYYTARYEALGKAGVNFAYQAAANGHSDAVDSSTVNTTNGNGDTPLHEAIQRNNSQAAEILIKKQANVEGKNVYGMTPLQLAVSQGRSEMVDVLLNYNADVNAKSEGGATALDFVDSSASGADKIITALRKKGAKTGDELKKEGSTVTPIITPQPEEKKPSIVEGLVDYIRGFFSAAKDEGRAQIDETNKVVLEPNATTPNGVKLLSMMPPDQASVSALKGTSIVNVDSDHQPTAPQSFEWRGQVKDANIRTA